MTSPKVIRKTSERLLYCEWEDGLKGTITMETFRKECPCAECTQDELNNKKTLTHLLDTFEEGKFQLKEVKAIGNYAIAVSWGDGHDSGIYTWEVLRRIIMENSLKEEEVNKYFDESNN